MSVSAARAGSCPALAATPDGVAFERVLLPGETEFASRPVLDDGKVYAVHSASLQLLSPASRQRGACAPARISHRRWPWIASSASVRAKFLLSQTCICTI